jgi:arginyl-tRNA synthetase
MVSLYALLNERLAHAFAEVAGKSSDPVLRRSQEADFRADGALAAAGIVGMDPRDFAARVLAQVNLSDLCAAVEVVGPGFISLTLHTDSISQQVSEMLADEWHGIAKSAAPQRVILDYSGPNAARGMNACHLRSTIIGDSIARLLEWLGHTVVQQNPIGDWDAAFGILIEHMLDVSEAKAAHMISAGDLASLYEAARAKFNTDEAFKARTHQRLVWLHNRDKLTLRFWKLLVDQSQESFLAVYRLLGVSLTKDDFAGESNYNDLRATVLHELDALDMLCERAKHSVMFRIVVAV